MESSVSTPVIALAAIYDKQNRPVMVRNYLYDYLTNSPGSDPLECENLRNHSKVCTLCRLLRNMCAHTVHGINSICRAYTSYIRLLHTYTMPCVRRSQYITHCSIYTVCVHRIYCTQYVYIVYSRYSCIFMIRRQRMHVHRIRKQ